MCSVVNRKTGKLKLVKNYLNDLLHGEYIYYWILTNYLKDIEDNIFSVKGFHMVNCNTFESRWITYTGYDRLMGRGNVVDTYVIPAIALDYFDWKYFHPEQTLYGTLLKKVCREKVNN